MTHRRFTKKRALVTGGTRGLGRTIAEWFTREGADLYISGREQVDIDRVCAELRVHGGEVWGSSADLSCPDQVHDLAERALENGPFDILVNNAGLSKPQRFLDVTDTEWDTEMTVNVRAPFLLSQHLARAMIAHNIPGRIVNISTIGVFVAHPRQMVYDMAKAAVQTMTANMAVELGGTGITVNCIAPGGVPDRPGFKEPYSNADAFNPTRRWGSAEDIANAVCFFCQDESGWITGQTLLVDGGTTLAFPEN